MDTSCNYFISFTPHINDEVDIIFFLWLRKLRLTKLKLLIQDHTAGI